MGNEKGSDNLKTLVRLCFDGSSGPYVSVGRGSNPSPYDDRTSFKYFELALIRGCVKPIYIEGGKSYDETVCEIMQNGKVEDMGTFLMLLYERTLSVKKVQGEGEGVLIPWPKGDTKISAKVFDHALDAGFIEKVPRSNQHTSLYVITDSGKFALVLMRLCENQPLLF